eukprot:TRINITY_DN28244_c0_g1_i1.p1 TRINITY_DN28244_c0_g1~~TRINITY_DN28244_c0_g1_i1.p1  ORF type:complete len:227 (+),score=40.59 TRINITY_DN28244_c0_g1_i1:125-805(+)
MPGSWMYRAVGGAPQRLRTAPGILEPRSGHLLLPGETFKVAVTLRLAAGVHFLRLADGRGWALERKPGGGPVLCEPLSSSVAPWKYQPVNGKAIGIRPDPDLDDSDAASEELLPGDVFSVSESRRGSDGVLFLKLADGRGWVFDRKPGVGTMCVPSPAGSSRRQLPRPFSPGSVTCASGGDAPSPAGRQRRTCASGAGMGAAKAKAFEKSLSCSSLPLPALSRSSR